MRKFHGADQRRQTHSPIQAFSLPASLSLLARGIGQKCLVLVRSLRIQCRKIGPLGALYTLVGGLAWIGAIHPVPASAVTRSDLEAEISTISVHLSTASVAQAALVTHASTLIAKLQKTNALSSSLVVAGVISSKAGKTVTLPITFIAGPTGVTAVQFDLLLPSTLTPGTVAVGPAATLANKQVQAAPVSGGLRVIVSGLNTTSIPTGVIANIPLTISASLAPNLYNLSLVNQAASNAAAGASLVSATSGTLMVTP